MKDESLSDKIEEWREVTKNHVRNINDLTKAHMIDMIDKVEEDVKEFIGIIQSYKDHNDMIIMPFERLVKEAGKDLI